MADLQRVHASDEQIAYSIRQAARLTGDSEIAVRRRIERGEFPARRWGKRRIVILREDLLQHLQSLPIRGEREGHD